MEEKLIILKTAILTKEKGFNIDTRFGYFGDYGELDGDNYPFLGTYSLIESPWNVLQSGKNYPAPTQSSLQRWLYEEHQIWVNCRPVYNANEQMGVQIDISSWKLPFRVVEEDDQYDIYKGLEKGLYEALELINPEQELDNRTLGQSTII